MIALIVAGVACAGGVQRRAEPTASARRSDCYRVTLGAWSSEPNLGPLRSTTVFRLDTAPQRPGAPGQLVAERIEPPEFAPPGDARARWQRPAYWQREGGDSVAIILWSTGTEAEVLYGRWDRQRLLGVVRRTSDAVPIDPRTRLIQWQAWP